MKLIKLCVTVFLISLACSGFTQDIEPASSQNATSVIATDYDVAAGKIENLYNNGRLSMIVSGYAYHDRHTYSEDHLSHINEKAWGMGMSKELRDDKDNEESIQFVVIADSHYQTQINASYSYQWMKPIAANWEIGAGFNAGLVSRQDIFSGVPIPAILPVYSVGTRDTKLSMTFVPHLSGTVNGNVLFFALRFNLK